MSKSKYIPSTAPITITELAEYIHGPKYTSIEKKRIYRILSKLHNTRKPILFRLGGRKNSQYYTSLAAIKEAGFDFDHTYFEENKRLEEEIEELKKEIKSLQRQIETLSSRSPR